MPSSPLREQVLDLALRDPQLRPRLASLLDRVGGLTPEERAALKKVGAVIQPAPIIVQQAPIIIQPPPMVVPDGQTVQEQPAPIVVEAPEAEEKSEAEVPANLNAPKGTQNAFSEELVPQLDHLVEEGFSRQQAARQVLDAVDTASRTKDMLYNILIRYQSSYENDLDFFGTLEQLIEAWVTANTEV